MLLNVHVKNLALIEDVDIYFGEGLNILTGETGAGKSIIIGSINIALGGKIPKDIIRKNAEFGLVELVFSLTDQDVIGKIKELGVEIFDDNLVVISRKITNGRSVIKINGETATSGFLKDVATLLLDVHGQHDHESLLNKAKHLEILDSFIGEEGNLKRNEIKQLYLEYKQLCNKLEEFNLDEETKNREMSFLEFEINEIEEASLTIGEDDLLEDEQKTIANSTKLLEALKITYDAITESENSASSLISVAAKEMSKICGINDKTQSLYESVMDLDSICQDFSYEISNYIDTISFDDSRVNYVYERLDLINKLKMKHGNSIEAILNKKQDFITKLDTYTHYDEQLSNLNDEISKATLKLKKACDELTKIRKIVANKVSNDIEEVLKTLNFTTVKFDVDFKKSDSFSQKGNDIVEFLISTNKGEEVKSLSSVASGGELSRIMLGIKTILANVDNIETLIFDEIDTGISGRTAQMVAEKMKMISKNHQVICITHLPQIAAMADDHFMIEKQTVNDSTVTLINKLSYDESIEELSRILGGAMITEAVVNNAKEMKKMALETKWYRHFFYNITDNTFKGYAFAYPFFMFYLEIYYKGALYE